jgi:hypothetical protein
VVLMASIPLEPDVVMELAGNRKLIVDAKVLLFAHDRYVSAETDEARGASVKQHPATGHAWRKAGITSTAQSGRARARPVHCQQLPFLACPGGQKPPPDDPTLGSTTTEPAGV